MIQLHRDQYAEARAAMVAHQLIRRGITNSAVLAALGEVPRERFVLDEQQDYAYDDEPLPIVSGQTISQPYIVAYMTELLKLGEPPCHILEVGTGAGYQAAVLAAMGHRVTTIERLPEVVAFARRNLSQLPYGEQVEVRVGDGGQGLPEAAPFDAILVTAATPRIPPALPGQLRLGGHLVIPCGNRHLQEMLQITKTTADRLNVRRGIGCRFVPLIGKDGFSEEAGG